MPGVAYLALAEELQREVLRAPAGARLPSEHELAASRGVSRITTRAALQELERRHLVVRRRGAGTFVALRVDYPISPSIPPSFSETIRRAGHVPGSKVLSVRQVRPPAAVRDQLELPSGESVVRLRRLGYVDGHTSGMHTSWLAHVDVDLIRDGANDDGSLFALLADAGYRLARESYTAEQDTIPADIGEALDLEGRPQAWHTFSRNRCRRTHRLVELNESWIRADVIRVRFELGASSTSHRPDTERT